MSNLNGAGEHEHPGSTSSKEVERGIAERLNELLGKSSVNAFALKCGIPESSMRKYLGGSIPGLTVADQIASANGVRLKWLSSGELPKWELSHEQVKIIELFNSYSTNMGVAGEKARLLFCRDYNNGEIPTTAAVVRAYPKITKDELVQWHNQWVDMEPVVKEPAGAYQAGINEALLVDIINEVEGALERRKGTLPAAKKAGLIAMLYDEYTRAEVRSADPDKVVRLIKLVS